MVLNVNWALGWLLVPWVIFAFWRWWNVCRYESNLKEWRRTMEEVGRKPMPPAVIWAAVKHIALQYDESLRRLLNQDYPDYAVVFAIESREDPAFGYLCGAFGIDPDSITDGCAVIRAESLRAAQNVISPGLKEVRIVIAGLANDEGQKVHNLLAAYRSDEGYGEIIAMSDADSHWPLDGLRNLALCVIDERVGFATGYRWLAPLSTSVPNLLASAINGSIATMLGKSAFRNYAWAGGLAIRREVFERYDIARLWRGKANDDYIVSMTLRKDMHPVFCPGLMALNNIDYRWGSFFNFARRQLIQAWVYGRRLWVYGFLIIVSYLGGWALVLIASLAGVEWTLLPGAMVYLIDMLRAGVRKRIIGAIFPAEACERLHPVTLVDRFLSPLSFLIFFFLLLSTAFTWRMTWGGITYDMGGGKTRVLSRKSISPHQG